MEPLQPLPLVRFGVCVCVCVCVCVWPAGVSGLTANTPLIAMPPVNADSQIDLCLTSFAFWPAPLTCSHSRLAGLPTCQLHDVVAQAARRTRGGPFAIKLYLSTSIPSAAAAGPGSSSPGPSSSSNARSIRSSKSAAGGAGSNRKKGGSMKFGTLPEIRRLHALTCSNVQPTSFEAVLAAGHAAGARAGRRDEPGGVGRAVMVSVNASIPERYRIKPRTYK